MRFSALRCSLTYSTPKVGYGFGSSWRLVALRADIERSRYLLADEGIRENGTHEGDPTFGVLHLGQRRLG